MRGGSKKSAFEKFAENFLIEINVQSKNLADASNTSSFDYFCSDFDS